MPSERRGGRDRRRRRGWRALGVPSDMLVLQYAPLQHVAEDPARSRSVSITPCSGKGGAGASLGAGREHERGCLLLVLLLEEPQSKQAHSSVPSLLRPEHGCAEGPGGGELTGAANRLERYGVAARLVRRTSGFEKNDVSMRAQRDARMDLFCGGGAREKNGVDANNRSTWCGGSGWLRSGFSSAGDAAKRLAPPADDASKKDGGARIKYTTHNETNQNTKAQKRTAAATTPPTTTRPLRRPSSQPRHHPSAAAAASPTPSPHPPPPCT